MADQKKPETIADGDLDTVQGAGNGGGKAVMKDMNSRSVKRGVSEPESNSLVSFGSEATT